MTYHFTPLARLFTAGCVLLALGIQGAQAREHVRVVGSGTVYPFTTLAAEQFGQNDEFKTPIVEATGTGGGFKLFCEGLGDNTPDINDASREIKDSEKELCKKNGVTDVREFTIGYDGIVIANKKGSPAFDLTKKQLFLGLAREVPDKNGKLITNPYTNWKQVDPTLPDVPIIMYGPGTVSGTRDTFVELVMEKGCEKVAAFTKAYPDSKERTNACKVIREDGKYIEAGEDYNILVQKLMSDERALALFGYGFYEQNMAKIQASRIEGITPTLSTVESGLYGIGRKLYLYVKAQHVGSVPGLAEFIQEIVSENAISDEGYLVSKGLLPLNTVDRQDMQAAADALAKP
jgi:phosphate transport system substrate-binding protein